MSAIDISAFHFLRPQWFYLAIPTFLLLVLLWRKRLSSGSWRSVVDKQLLPHVLIGQDQQRGLWALLAIALAGVLALTALAGPVWEKLEQPVFRQQSALVILLDLSRSMDANDLRPSRLERARLKLRDILKLRSEGQTALMTYAAMPFVVTPLTSDTSTIADQLPSLTTDLMPTQGSRPDRAINQAIELLQQAGVRNGSVLLVTDGVSDADSNKLEEAITALVNAGHKFHILGVGTRNGAPIPRATGGFLTGPNGAIVIPKLNSTRLSKMARHGHGIYQSLRVDDRDINTILAAIDQHDVLPVTQKSEELNSDQWREAGAWLLLPLLVIVLPVFRRGVLASMLLVVIVFPYAGPAQALEWDALWKNPDQRGKKALEEGQEDRAVELFQQPEWRAAAQYRAGQFDQALDTLVGIEGADAAYNRGNALAKMQRLKEALSAYEQALALSPQHEDARFNADLIKQALRNQNNTDPDNSDQGDQGKDNQGNENQQQQGQSDQDQQGKDSSQSSADENQQDASGSQQGNGQQNGSQSSASTNGQDSSDPQSPQQAMGEKQSSDADSSEAEQSAITEEDMSADQSDQQANQSHNQNKDPNNTDAGDDTQTAQRNSADQTISASELQQATEQWLRRIPDDPGGLWRRKFLYQYQQQNQQQGDEEQAW